MRRKCRNKVVNLRRRGVCLSLIAAPPKLLLSKLPSPKSRRVQSAPSVGGIISHPSRVRDRYPTLKSKIDSQLLLPIPARRIHHRVERPRLPLPEPENRSISLILEISPVTSFPMAWLQSNTGSGSRAATPTVFEQQREEIVREIAVVRDRLPWDPNCVTQS